MILHMVVKENYYKIKLMIQHHISIVPRINRFVSPLRAWLRSFPELKPTSMTMADARVFAAPIRVDVMHRVVHWHQCALRKGLASTKHRSDVRGSTRKIYRQKGTGKARAGSIRAPQRKGGARCFGPKPRNFYFFLHKKVRAMGLRSALSTKFAQGQLSFVSNDGLRTLRSYKASQLQTLIDNTPVRSKNKKILLVDTQKPCQNLLWAMKSFSSQIMFMNATTDHINAHHVLRHSFVLLSQDAKMYFQRKLVPSIYQLQESSISDAS